MSSTVKLVVVGDNTGINTTNSKTLFLITSERGSYPTGYIPRVFENYTKKIDIFGKSVTVGLWVPLFEYL
jgi:hypothetical protein